MDAGRHWVLGSKGSDTEEIVARFAEMGAPPEVLAQIRQRPATSHFQLWAEHEEAWKVFRLMGTQWRFIAAGLAGSVQQGIDYASLIATIGLEVAQEKRREVFHQVRKIERGALDAMGE